MKIGMLNVDGHSDFPPLALMKLSAWHKQQGDEVEIFFPMNSYDRVYKSKVFDFSPDFETCINATEVIEGGIAYGLENKLPEEVYHTMPDYSLYGITDTAYGFLTRGCPRNCSFCNVTQHQGNKSIKVSDLSEFWTGHKNIKLLDPNITACKDWRKLFQQLINSKAKVDFSQGIDIRTMTKEKVEYLNKIRWDMLHFAWDNYEMKTYKMLQTCREYFKVDGRKLTVYVLVNYDTTIDQDLERIYKLRALDYSPYVMIFDKRNAPKKIKEIARWVNNRFIWRSCETFDEYRFVKETNAEF